MSVSSATIEREQPYVDLIDKYNYIPRLNQSEEETIKEYYQRESSALSGNRYQFGNPRDRMLIGIFNKAFQLDPDRVIAAAEAVHVKRFYSLWKKVCYIQIPELVGRVLKRPVLNWACAAFFSYKIFLVGQYFALDLFPRVLLCRIIPFIQAVAPPQVMAVCQAASMALSWVFSHPWEFFAGIYIIGRAIQKLPPIPYLTALASRITILNLIRLFPGADWTIVYVINDSIALIMSMTDQSQSLGKLIDRVIVDPAKRNYRNECKAAAFQVWKEAVERIASHQTITRVA
ncbi:MAG: hypothetical protein HW387_1258 [Parachlamydiales bacterium]|nr:hypothetical protein [Parachlamydiales bacterium]